VKSIDDAARELLSTVQLVGSIESGLLVKRSGVHLASWSKHEIPLEVYSVMAAAAVGAVDTLLEALGMSCPRQISIETDDHRLLFTKADPQVVLVLVASKGVRDVTMRREAQRLLRALARVRREKPAAAERVLNPPERMTIER